MALELTNLSPRDAAVALRSYPRRYRDLLTPVGEDDDLAEIAHRIGSGGRSVLDIVSDVTRTWVVLREALRRIVVDDRPVLHPAVGDPARRAWDAAPPDSPDDALALLSDEADAFAAEIDRVASDDFLRVGDLAGGGSLTAVDVVREAVRVGHDGLDDTSRTLQDVRGR